MTKCDFKPTDETDGKGRRKFRCERCKYLSVFIPDKGQYIDRDCNRQMEGWGDKLARWLSYVGITQPRFEAVLGGCGGCEARQVILNHVGWQLHDRWRTLSARWRRWWG
jgi:hypothetical protein